MKPMVGRRVRRAGLRVENKGILGDFGERLGESMVMGCRVWRIGRYVRGI